MTRKITDEHLSRLRRDDAGDWVWHDESEARPGSFSERGAPGLFLTYGTWVKGSLTADELDDALAVLYAIRERLEDEQRERHDALLLARLGDLVPDGLNDASREWLLRHLRAYLEQARREVAP